MTAAVVRQLAHRMPFTVSHDCIPLITLAQRDLGMSQAQLADLFQTSRRTITRIVASKALPSTFQLHVLARALHPVNPELAARLAAEGNATLEGLGIVQPAAPPPPPPPEPPPVVELPPPVVLAPEPPPRPQPPPRLMVESIVCAAAETMQTTPSAVRDVLRTAFARARGLGMTIEEVDDALSPPPVAAPAQAAVKKIASKRR